MGLARELRISGNQKGVALVYLAVSILVLAGLIGLAVDMGRMYVVRGELQNAADATALAGAGLLYPKPITPGAPLAVDWTSARTTALNFINKNRSDGTTLSDGDIQCGYWNITLQSWGAGSPVITGVPPVAPSCTPAVAVKISRSGGHNGGPVPTFFAKLLGFTGSAVSSRQAIATSGAPGSAPPGNGFPLAVTRCLTDDILSHKPIPDTPIEIHSMYHTLRETLRPVSGPH